MRGPSRRLRFARGGASPGCCFSTASNAYMARVRAEKSPSWALSGVLPLEIMLGVWEWFGGGRWAGAVARSASAATSVGFVVRQIHDCSGWCMSSERRRAPGRLSPYLLHAAAIPSGGYASALPPLRAGHAALPFVVLIMAIFFLFQPAAFWLPQPGRLPGLAVVAIHLAFLLRFLFSDRDAP